MKDPTKMTPEERSEDTNRICCAILTFLGIDHRGPPWVEKVVLTMEGVDYPTVEVKSWLEELPEDLEPQQTVSLGKNRPGFLVEEKFKLIGKSEHDAYLAAIEKEAEQNDEA